MTGLQLIEECSAAGVKISVQGERVSLEGDDELVARYAELLRPHKALIIASSNQVLPSSEVAQLRGCVPIHINSATSLIQEFMEVDGLTREEAEALAAVSVLPRPAAEWIAMIQELDALIDRYCQVCRLSEDARLRIWSIRLTQSLASIPVALLWFRRELESRG